MSEARTEVEAEIRARVQAGDHGLAATLAIETYGPELMRFIGALVRDEAAACDVFSQTCESLWRGLPNMQWQSSLRTWAYSIARHACYRHLRSPAQRRAVPLSGAPEVERAAASVRSATLRYLRTDVKDRFARLRDALTPEEQSLLTLRIDRQLDWNEIAQVLADEALDVAALKRASAACRKRFERLSDKLRELARAEGLLDDEA